MKLLRAGHADIAELEANIDPAPALRSLHEAVQWHMLWRAASPELRAILIGGAEVDNGNDGV